ncbi:sensor histidine kinase [Paractinoplanes rishiriensis]|uniref:histidine kinase n=1 Tax=Paractinoplanes rishiriensis TaxID=1050105 RepID=A0A919MSJ7_9ACTN|nr:histidine kinase [Actinoplanes rishiriensis]GIE93279.1 hypothetical protein Ari01nite_07440 [Actinoplanes rishiriensis]
MGRWLVPALIAVAQLAWWPGAGLLRGTEIPPAAAAVWGVTVVAGAAALCWRRHRPVLVLVALTVLAALPFPDAWDELGTFAPGDAMLSGVVPHFVAVFSVAARCAWRTTALVLGGVLTVIAVVMAMQDGVDPAWAAVLVMLAGCYGLIAVAGRRRGRWVRERTAAAERLAEARQAGREAAGVERRRLARELHDLTAHHLTSIVLNASAAGMLAGERPELRAEALDFAVRTGRETLDSLHRLVDVLPLEAAPDLDVLAEEFRQLGQQVHTDVPAGELPPAVASAAYGIAREALTNTLRYAPGGRVRLALEYAGDEARLTVEDDGGDARAAARGLGGGRGLTGMRERAHALGGRLVAGPRPEGGWRVHAVFPSPAGEPSQPVRRRATPALLRLGPVLFALVFPMLQTGVAAVDDGLGPATAATILAAQIAHAGPLWWRRAHPWTVFTAVLLTAWLGPALILTGVVPGEFGWMFATAVVADLLALYALGSWAGPPALTWLGAAAAAVVWGLGLVTLALHDPNVPGDMPAAGDGPAWVMAGGFVGLLAACVLFVPMFLCWLPGYAAGRRRIRRHAREEGAVEVALARAAELTRDERDRLAAGLRGDVLRHAAEVPAAAERGDLGAVVVAARQSLAAMRALLDGLGRVAPPVAERDQVSPGAIRPLL